MQENAPHLITPEIQAEQEQRTIAAILAEAEFKALGPFEVTQVGFAGFLITRKEIAQPSPHHLGLDFDDAMVDYSGAKKRLLAEYTEYLKSFTAPVSYSTESVEKILKAIDAFSRWPDAVEAQTHFHLSGYATALSWATDVLINGVKSNKSETEIVAYITKKISSSKPTPGALLEPDPELHWSFNSTRLVTPTIGEHTASVSNLLERTLEQPNQFDDFLSIMKNFENSKLFTLDILTGGAIYFQLIKTLKFLQAHPDLPIARICISKVPKGSFLAQVATMDAFNSTSEPADFLMLDDLPKEITSILNAQPKLLERLNLAAVRIWRAEVKSSENEMAEMPGATTLDVRKTGTGSQADLTHQEMYQQILEFYYQQCVAKHGADNPRTQAVLTELTQARQQLFPNP